VAVVVTEQFASLRLASGQARHLRNLLAAAGVQTRGRQAPAPAPARASAAVLMTAAPPAPPGADASGAAPAPAPHLAEQLTAEEADISQVEEAGI
jgi:hypothetical protein